MAPLRDALKVHLLNKGVDGGATPYSVWGGKIDGVWTVANSPHGGYAVGLLLEAATGHQSLFAPDKPNPVHVTAHFLRPCEAFSSTAGAAGASSEGQIMPPAVFEARIRSVKSGKSLCTLFAEFVQKDQARIIATVIYGEESPDYSEDSALVPPSPYARRIPHRTHPQDCPPHWDYDLWNFKKSISSCYDPALDALNETLSTRLPLLYKTETSSKQFLMPEPPGVQFGGWLTLLEEDKTMRPSMLAFCADIVKPLPEILPKEVNPMAGSLFYATLTMTIEFKAPLSVILRDDYSSNTFGLYTLGRFMQEPMGRHETYMEVWSSPKIGDESNAVNSDWREKQRVLAVATHTALSIPIALVAMKAKM